MTTTVTIKNNGPERVALYGQNEGTQTKHKITWLEPGEEVNQSVFGEYGVFVVEFPPMKQKAAQNQAQNFGPGAIVQVHEVASGYGVAR